MPNAATDSQRTRRRREKLRAAGLRPLQLWVPDTNAPGFAEEYRRQFALLAEADKDDADGTLAWLEENNRELFEDLDRAG